MSWKQFSRAGLALCLTGSLALTGCATGGLGKLMGRKDQPSAQLTLAWSRLKEDEGSLTEARSGYEKVLAEQPNNVDAILGMARLNVKAQRVVEAEQGFTRALKLQPKSAPVLSEVGQFYANLQRWDKAIPLLQEAQRIEPHERTHQFTLGVALTSAGRVSEALPHFTEAVGEAAAHYNIGRMLVETGRTSEAEQQFLLALRKDPNLEDAKYFLAEIRNNRGEVKRTPQYASATTGEETQQVSGNVVGRTQVTPAAVTTATGREPLYPHAGYEELPAPPAVNGPGILPASGFTPVGQTMLAPPSIRPSDATQ